MRKVSEAGPVIPDEGERVERKESLSLWREIVRSCAAFATAHGGRVYVGVADDGRVIGVQIGKGTLEDLTNKIAQNTNPRVVPAVAVMELEGKKIITIDVSEHPTKPVYAFDIPLRQSGRTNHVLSPSEASELYLATRGMTWDETVLPEASLQDIDSEKVRAFLQRAKAERNLDVDPDMPMEQALRRLQILRDGKLTIAAVLLFGKHPEQFMVQSVVRCARFKGDDTNSFLDMKVIEGTVIDQVKEVMLFLQRHISMAAELKDLEREEHWEYPLRAVLEAITNAVCHRDYADTGNVQLRIFDHSLEVWNPGALPAGLTVEDLRGYHDSKPRNKLIAHAFFLIRFIEQFGTGTGRMIDRCREAGIPEPEFESRARSFRVSFRKTASLEQRFADLNKRQLAGLKFLRAKGKITSQEYMSEAGCSERTAKRDLAEMVKKKILVSHGKTKGRWYEFAEK